MHLTHRSTSLPDVETLTGALRAALAGNGIAGSESLAVIERRENLETTTAPTEIVRCRLAGGREFTLLCKYAAAPEGHRRGVAYESDVYRQVLMPLGASTPRFFGAHIDSVTGDTLLFIENLEDLQRVTWREEPDAYTWGIRWIARFHARAEAFLRGNSLPFLLHLDTAYYARWVERAAVLVDAAGRYRWFPSYLSDSRRLAFRC